jgi:hypothetical protein
MPRQYPDLIRTLCDENQLQLTVAIDIANGWTSIRTIASAQGRLDLAIVAKNCVSGWYRRMISARSSHTSM